MAFSYIPKIVYNATTIEFDYPPEGDTFGERLKFNGRITKSRSGVQQTITNYIEQINGITYSFVSESVKQSLNTFLITHGLLGKDFEYWFDKDEVSTKFTVKLDSSSMNPKFNIITRKGEGFIYRLQLVYRRVIA
jgi:hypothetical protein